MYNGCVFLISYREKHLIKCLELLYKNYTSKYPYPTLVFYHKNTFTKDYCNKVCLKVKGDIKFIEIKFENIDLDEKDMFYNKTFLRYVKKNFSKNRIGYLHANYFWNNFFKYQELTQYDWTMRIDDDSFFIKPIQNDMFETLDKNYYNFGTGYMWNYIDQNIKDTRYKLFEFTKDFCKDITPVDTVLKKGLEDTDLNLFKKDIIKWNCGNCNLYKMSVFKETNWIEWNDAFNKIHGGYRYRWGDIEILQIYCMIFDKKGFYNFDLVKKNIYFHTKRLKELDKKLL